MEVKINSLPLLIFYVIRYVYNRNTEFLCVLIAFKRTAIKTPFDLLLLL